MEAKSKAKELSPQNPQINSTPFFHLEYTENKQHSNSVKEFSLGKPQAYRHRSTYKKPTMGGEPGPANLENYFPSRHLDKLKQIRDDYQQLVAEMKEQMQRNTIVDLNNPLDDITLLLNDDTRINQSFINESNRHVKHTKVTNNDNSVCIMTNSQIMNSIERVDRNTATPDKMQDSVFLKSFEFPKLIKRKAARNYTKFLIPDQPQEAGQLKQDDWNILDIYQITKRIREESKLEVFEGICMIRNMKRPVYIKRSREQELIMREILTQLIFYEKEIDFRDTHLLKMRDFFCTKDQYYVIYDLPGERLSSIDCSQLLSGPMLLKKVGELSHALTSLHNAGVVHLKINTESICLSSATSPTPFSLKLCEFDRAIQEFSDKVAKTEVDCCSAPEVIFPAGFNPDKKADYWSFGCVVYFMATGQHLFPTGSKAGIFYLVDQFKPD